MFFVYYDCWCFLNEKIVLYIFWEVSGVFCNLSLNLNNLMIYDDFVNILIEIFKLFLRCKIKSVRLVLGNDLVLLNLIN